MTQKTQSIQTKPQINFKKLSDYFTENISPSELAKMLDQITRNYSIYLIEDQNAVRDEGAAHVYHLGLLRDILLDIEVSR